MSIGVAALIALGDNAPEHEEDYEAIGSAAGFYDDWHEGRDPVGISTQDDELAARFDPELGARRLANYLRAMVLETQTLARACGKSHVHNLEPEDLVALTVEAAAMARVPLAGTGLDPGPRRRGLTARCASSACSTSPASTPARSPTSCAGAGSSYVPVELDEGEPPARTGASFDAVLAMGGPMSVNDEAEHPWLRRGEGAGARRGGGGRGFLGVCLGSQLLASALGRAGISEPRRRRGRAAAGAADAEPAIATPSSARSPSRS